MNLCTENAEDTLVSISLAFNHFNHNGACVPTSMQESYLPDFVDYYSALVVRKLMDRKRQCEMGLEIFCM